MGGDDLTVKSGTGPSGIAPVETGKSPVAAGVEAKNLSAERQKGTFSKPLDHNAQTNPTAGAGNRAFSTFLTSASNIRLPETLSVQSARSAYASFMEARGLKKELTTIKQLKINCEKIGVSPGEPGKTNSETIAGLKKQIADKVEVMSNELVQLVEVCVEGNYITKPDEENKGFDINWGIRSELSPKTQKIIESYKEKVSNKDLYNAVEQLKSAINRRPALQIIKAEAMQRSLSENVQADVKANPLSNIKAMTDQEIINFQSSGNAMKDFIKCGEGFKAKEVMINGSIQVVKESHKDDNGNKDVNAKSIAMGLIAIYPDVIETKGDDAGVGDKVLRDLEGAITEAETKSSETDKFSARGELAQANRVLDITMAMIESNMYNPLINQDLDKKDQSRIKNIIEQSSKFPELQAKKEKLETLVLNQANSILKINTNTEEAAAFKASLDSVRNGTLQKGELNALAESIAQDSKEICISLFKNMDGRELLKPQEGRKKLIEYSANLSFVVANDILDAKTPEQVKNSMEFYTKLAMTSIDKGDFLTAAAIVTGGLQAGSVTNLTHPPGDGEPFVTLSQTHKITDKERKEGKTGYKDLDMLNDLFNPASANKNLREAQAKAKNANSDLIPFIGIAMGDIANVDATEDVNPNKKNDNLKNIPNPDFVLSMGKQLEDISKVSGLKGGAAENTKGFSSSVLDINFGEDLSGNPISVTKATEALYAKSRELRQSQGAAVEGDVVKKKRRFSNPFEAKEKSSVDSNKEKRNTI